MPKYNLYSAEEIAALDLETFNSWINSIYQSPTKPVSTDGTILHPSKEWLNECWCMTWEHCRQLPLDPRTNYEKKILNSDKDKNPNEVIRLLSLGSGGLFQDLMIILKLYFAGYKNIALDCIENQPNNKQQAILQSIIERLNENNATIKVQHFSSMDERREAYNGLQQTACDVVYAIDFDDFNTELKQDFSSRTTMRNYYHGAAVLLGAYSELDRSRESLFLLSFGGNYLLHQGNSNKSGGTKIDSRFEKRMQKHAYHDYYYINTNILLLLLHYPFLKEKTKPILINERILNEQNVCWVKIIGSRKHCILHWLGNSNRSEVR